jgi:hypothetical protein
MMQRMIATKRTATAVASFITLLSLGFAECAATAKSHDAKLRQDARTCESFGVRYGTTPYANCMLDQQRRRDTKKLDTLEESQMLSQLAKDGQIMSDRARRQRCDRNPDRRECGRR